MNRYLPVVLLLIVASSLSSCSVKKVFGKRRKHGHTDSVAVVPVQPEVHQGGVAITPLPSKPVIADTPVTAVVETPAMALLIDSLTPLWKRRLSYNTFSGKAKMSFDGPTGSADFTANFRIKKDSIIWIHVTALGGTISAARIFVTRDSFFLINYLQKQATKIALKDAGKTLPAGVDFTQLQNVIVGEPLKDGNITEAISLPAVWNITVQDTSYIQHITYARPDGTMSTGQMTTLKPNGPTAQIDYSNYDMVTGRKISTTRSVKVQNGDKIYDIDMNFVNAEFDKEQEYPFSIPKNYSVKNPK